MIIMFFLKPPLILLGGVPPDEDGSEFWDSDGGEAYRTTTAVGDEQQVLSAHAGAGHGGIVRKGESVEANLRAR